MKKIKLFCFGFGQVAKYFAKKLINEKYNLNILYSNLQKKFKKLKIFILIKVLLDLEFYQTK